MTHPVNKQEKKLRLLNACSQLSSSSVTACRIFNVEIMIPNGKMRRTT